MLLVTAVLIGLGVLAWLFLGRTGPTDGNSSSAHAAAAASVAAAAAARPDGGCQNGRSLYVSPDGKPANDGALETPLDLVTALSANGPAKPCDTIWLRGGTYRGAFRGALSGTDGSPIVVRALPGERAILDSGGSADPGLHATGSWTWYWGFEVTNSDPQRTSKESGPWPSDLRRGTGVASTGSHVKFINLVVHDMARGFDVNENATDNEFYGNLIYHNGWEGAEGVPRGNGIDTRNQVGSRRLADNIIFDQFSHGISILGEFLDNITLEGNVVFNNGSISKQGVTESRNILLGGTAVANNPVVRANVTYNGQTNLGYDAGCSGATVADNYFAGPLIWVKCSGEFSGNILFDPSGGGYGPLPSQFPANTYETARPGGLVVRVRRNEHEPGRAHVVVFNWAGAPEARLNPSDAGLRAGDRFEVRDAQDYFGRPAVTGTTNGGPVVIPLTNTSVAAPTGAVPVPPKHTPPEFSVFVVQKLNPSKGT